MAGDLMTTTTVDAYSAAVISRQFQIAATHKIVFAKIVSTKFSSDISAQGQSVFVPIYTVPTAADKVSGTATTWSEQSAEGGATVLIDQHKEVARLIEDVSKVQSTSDLLGYAEADGKGLANAQDLYLANLLVDAAVTQNVGDVNSGLTAYTAITEAGILSALEILWDNNMPRGDGKLHLVVEPGAYADLLLIDRFTAANKIPNSNAIATGALGMIHGANVWMCTQMPSVAFQTSLSAGHPNIPAYKVNALFHQDSMTLATQINPRRQQDYSIDYTGTKYKSDVLFGAGIITANQIVQIRTTP